MTGNPQHIDLLSTQHYIAELESQLTEEDRSALALMLPYQVDRRKFSEGVNKKYRSVAPEPLKDADTPSQKPEISGESVNIKEWKSEDADGTEVTEQNKPEEKLANEKTEPSNKTKETGYKEDHLKQQLNRQISSSAISSYIADEVDRLAPESEKAKEQSKVEPQSPEFEEKTEPLESQRKSFSDWLNSIDPKAEKEPAQPRHSSIRVIDDFIKQNPQIVRSGNKEKRKFFKASEHAKQSIEENEGLYTETYARILEAQGNPAKAILVYEKLALKFPEKKAYFAARIKAVSKH